MSEHAQYVLLLVGRPPYLPLKIAAEGWGQQEGGCTAHAHSPGHQRLGTNTHGVKVILYFLYSPVFQAHILYFRGKEKIPIFCINSPVFPIF